MTIYAIHAPEAEHLAEVQAEMERLGAPTLRVVDCGGHYQALEGSHRLAAAYALGLEPELEIYQVDDLIDITVYDWYEADPGLWAERTYTAGEVVAELFSARDARDYRWD